MKTKTCNYYNQMLTLNNPMPHFCLNSAIKYRLLACLLLVLTTFFDARSQVFEQTDKLTATYRHWGLGYGGKLAGNNTTPFSISENYAVLGMADSTDASHQNGVYHAGSAYILKKEQDGKWHNMQKISGTNRFMQQRFGNSVAIYRDFIVVGAIRDSCGGTHREVGAVYVFKRNVNGLWQETQILTASDRMCGINQHFGHSVSISGNLMVIGSYGNQTDENNTNTFTNSGAAYIFELKPNGMWEEVQKITASDRKSQAAFSQGVFLNENQELFVTAPRESTDSDNQNPIQAAGAVYVFEKDNNGKFYQTAKLTASDRKVNARFGHSDLKANSKILAISSILETADSNNLNIITPSPGAAYVFIKDENGKWNEVQKLTALHRTDWGTFGVSVSVYNDLIAVGANGDQTDENGNNPKNNSGAVYVYKQGENNRFHCIQKVVTNERPTYDWNGNDYGISLGGTVALTEDELLVGAGNDFTDSLGDNSIISAGALYVFKQCVPTKEEITDTSCGSYTLNGQTFTQSGTYEQILKNETGCDSILTLHLTIRDTFYFSQHVFVCKGNSIQVGTNTYSDTGIYIDTFTMANGCDSLVETRLAFYPSYNDTQIVSICFGDTLYVNNAYYLSSGFYSDTFQSVNGCDSIINTALTVLDTVHYMQNISICQGDSFKVHLRNYTSSGTYYDTLLSAKGCDSIVTTQLIVNSGSQSTDSVYICSGESVMIGGKEINTSGIYTMVYQANNGCDSIVHTHLYVHPPIIPEVQLNSTALIAYPSGATYQWLDCLYDDPIEGETAQTYTPYRNGEYAVMVTVGECTEITPCIKYSRQSEIYLPTAFSPNGDGLNDTYKPIYEGWLINKMSVFNRWGELIYESTDPNASWDGTYQGQPAPQGVYAILIVFQAMESKGSVQLIEQRNVSVQLLR
jgi:gliding motility-associated-like protein